MCKFGGALKQQFEVKNAVTCFERNTRTEANSLIAVLRSKCFEANVHPKQVINFFRVERVEAK
jgi:hypothetical protein